MFCRCAFTGSARATPSKPAGSKAQPPRKQPGQRTAAGARTRQPAGRRSGSSSAGGRKSLASVLHGSTWRVDGGLRLQQQEQQQDVSEGRMGAESSRCALTGISHATAQSLQTISLFLCRVSIHRELTHSIKLLQLHWGCLAASVQTHSIWPATQRRRSCMLTCTA